MKEAWPVIKLAGPELVALARRYRRLAVIVLLTVALVEAGILVVRFIKTHQPPPGVAPVAQAGHAQPSAATGTESKQLIDQANAVLNAETQVLSDFKASCEATLNQDSTKSDDFGKQMEFARLQAELEKVFDSQSTFLKKLQNQLRLAGATTTKGTVQATFDRLEKTASTRSEQQGNIYDQVKKFDEDLKQAAANARPRPSGNSAMDMFGN